MSAAEQMRKLMENLEKVVSEDATGWFDPEVDMPPTMPMDRKSPEWEATRADAVLALTGDARSVMRKDVAKKWLLDNGFSDEYINHYADMDKRGSYWKKTWSGDEKTHFMPPSHFAESASRRTKSKKKSK